MEVNKMKTSKKIISVLLCAVMVLSTFCGIGLVLDDFKASAAVTLSDGDISITQQRIVSNYESIYAGYQQRYFLGEETNWPTNFVIPGLASSDDYTPQGMTYWEEKEWILISAYDASTIDRDGDGVTTEDEQDDKLNSVVYALDATTTDFVALFKIYNSDGSVNISHGGGIAASKYNFYYADSDSMISYVPLSEMDVPAGTVKNIYLKDSIDCSGELYGAKTSYCCYDDGVLWTGNFYYDSSDYDYAAKANASYNSMLIGYKLKGNSSEEEWFNLQDKNLINATGTGALSYSNGSGTMSYNVALDENGYIDITGSIAHNSGTAEYAPSFGTIYLIHGFNYVLEFDLNEESFNSDIYFLRDGGTGSYTNVKYAANGDMKITDNGDGTWHFELPFSPGSPIHNASGNRQMDGNWDTIGDSTGTYTIRFDQDDVSASKNFQITNLHVSEAIEGFAETKKSSQDCAGNPTYAIALNNDIDKVQYAMVDKGKIYISRSWGRSESGSHIRELVVGDIDINSPGTATLTVNGRSRTCHLVDTANVTKFGGSTSGGTPEQMLYMGEGLCVIEDYLYMFGEGAAWNYNGKSDSVCTEPIDVIWKIDQYAIMGDTRDYDDSTSIYYQKVNNLSEINDNDQYIVVFESPEVDPVSQRNILYALDSYGGYGDYKLPKSDDSNQAVTGDSMGVIGYKISDYSVDGDKIYISEEDDANKSIRWRLRGANSGNLRIENMDLYYSTNKYLYFGSRIFRMATEATTALSNVKLVQQGTGDFRFYYDGTDADYYLWCNDGLNQTVNDTYTNFYANHGKTGYIPNYDGLTELAGTFHADAEYAKGNTTDSGNITTAGVGIEPQIMHIYKRVADPYTSTYESRIYTDLGAELQADGTYTINLETYAISQRQYQQVNERPTDFIFVLDASGSMYTNQDAAGYEYHNSGLNLKTAGTADQSDSIGNTDGGTYTGGNIYYQHPSDGTYCKFNVETSDRGNDGSWISPKYYKYVWLYYTHNGTTYYYYPGENTFKTTKPSESETIKASGNSDGARADATIYTGPHYVNYSTGGNRRLDSMKNAVNGLTYKIANEAARTGLDHRIALVTFGSDGGESWNKTGMYINSSNSMIQYTGEGSISAANYANAFYGVDQFASLRTSIQDGINTSDSNPDTFSNYGLDMANGIIANSGANYFGDGNRSVCIIMITDGVPGLGGDDSSSANTVAAAAITEAYEAKFENGAYIYTVQMGNNSMSGFDMDKYMDYVSSEYVYATAMGTPGDRNIKDVEYRIDVPTGSDFNLDNLVNDMFSSVTSNSTNALAKLDAESILREHLTDAFIIPDDADITIQTADSYHDGIGRLHFNAPVNNSSVKTTIDKATNVITATGYDYTTEYISSKHEGSKLVITIEGVLANANADLVNTSINDTSETAIYQDSTFMNNGIAVKYFPTENFTIPEYTYILDYDLPMKDIDVNGTMLSVDSTPAKQTTYKTSLDTETIGLDFADNNQNLIYSLNSGKAFTVDNVRGYILIDREDGTYDWFRINVLPASNVLFEEDKIDVSDTSGKTKWASAGTSENLQQSLSTDNDVYGYDAVYSGNVGKYSNGTYLTSTVSSDENRSNTATFKFAGTGFDLISACGESTGIQIVTVKNSAGKIVKVYIVDTFYSDSNVIQSGSIFTQVPIVSYSGAYDTYTVEATAAYLKQYVATTPELETQAVGDTGMEAYTAQADKAALAELLADVGMEELANEDVELIWFDEESVLNGGRGAEIGGETAVAESYLSVQSAELSTAAATAGKVTYEWSGYIPCKEDGTPLVTLPTDGNTYAEGAAYTVNTTYTSESKIDHYSGNGYWRFSGWTDANKGVMPAEGVVLTGEWHYYPENYTVTYKWNTRVPSAVKGTKPVDLALTGAEVSFEDKIDTTYSKGYKIDAGNGNYWQFSGWRYANSEKYVATDSATVELVGTWTFYRTEMTNSIDGIRIYNPLTNDAAYVVNETNAEYYNVVDKISAGGMGGDSLVAYIEGGSTGSDIGFGNYSTSGGPSSEVYLNAGSGNAVAFKFKVSMPYANPPKAMLGLRAVSGNPKVKIGIDSTASRSISFDLTSSTEMYYNITDYLQYGNAESDGQYFIVTVENVGDSGLLAVGNLKIANADLVATSSADLLQVASLMSLEATPVEVEALQTSAPESKYPDYVPAPRVENPDPGLDAEGELPVAPPSDSNDGGDDEPAYISFFKKLAATIKSFFEFIIGLVPFIGEVLK